jgi:hypothetical protein
MLGRRACDCLTGLPREEAEAVTITTRASVPRRRALPDVRSQSGPDGLSREAAAYGRLHQWRGMPHVAALSVAGN